MCEYRGFPPPAPPGGVLARANHPDPRAVEGWPRPLPPARWVLRQLGRERLDALVGALFARLYASPAGYRLPAAPEARAALVASAAEELARCCAGGGVADAGAGSAFLVGFRGTADLHARDAWLACLKATLAAHAPQPALARELWGWFEPLSTRMVNYRVTRSAMVRYPYRAVAREIETHAVD